MLRTFRRSGLPIWYTEGFHSHPYYSFALALSLGFESSCEILDFNLNEEVPYEEIKERLNAVMPEGMKILSVAEPKLKITHIAKAERASYHHVSGQSAVIELSPGSFCLHLYL